MRLLNKGLGPRGVPGSTRENLFGATYATANDGAKALRRAAGYYGKGGYSFLNGFLSGNSVSMGNQSYTGYGKYIKPFSGNSFKLFGHDLLKVPNKILGLGDYSSGNVTNQIMGGATGPISVNSSGDLSGDIVLNHTEFVGNLTATGTSTGISAFQNSSFPLNPGLSQTFPWLAQLAQNFILYQFEGLIFQYRPTSGEFGSANGNTLGKITMATQYDSDAAPFSSGIEAANYDYAMTCKPSASMEHGVETARSQQPLGMSYIRTGQSNKDKVFTDIGYLQVMTEGIPIPNNATGTIGEIWVTYKVRLSRATLFGSLLGKNVLNDMFLLSSDANILGYNATSAIANYGSQATWASNYQDKWLTPGQAAGNGTAVQTNLGYAKKTNTLGCVVQQVTPGKLNVVFPKGIAQGTYKFTIFLDSAGTAVATWSQPLSSNITVVNGTLIVPSGLYFTSAPANYSVGSGGDGVASATVNTLMFTFQINIAAPGALQCSVQIDTHLSGLQAYGYLCAMEINEVCTGCYT